MTYTFESSDVEILSGTGEGLYSLMDGQTKIGDITVNSLTAANPGVMLINFTSGLMNGDTDTHRSRTDHYQDAWR